MDLSGGTPEFWNFCTDFTALHEQHKGVRTAGSWPAWLGFVWGLTV